MSCGLVDRAFVGELSRRQHRRLRAHLETCEPCRERWQRLAIVDRELGGPELSRAMTESIRAAVVPQPRARWTWAIGAAAAAATSLLIFVMVRTPRDEALTARGGHTHGRTPGIRLFCVAGDRDHVRTETRMVSNGPAPSLRCTITDDLQLAYTSPPHEAPTMVAFARIADSRIPYGQPVAVLADRVDEIVDWSIHLAYEHRVGTYDVVARFFMTDGVVELHATLEIVPAGGLDDAP
jgi:hypothetical protein